MREAYLCQQIKYLCYTLLETLATPSAPMDNAALPLISGALFYIKMDGNVHHPHHTSSMTALTNPTTHQRDHEL